MKALPLALLIACPDSFLFFSLSRFWWVIQLPHTENCPWICKENWCFSFCSIILASSLRVLPWAFQRVWMSLLYTLISQDPFFLSWGVGGWEGRSLLTNWFHNSFIKPSSKPFILAPFCSIKSCMSEGRGEFGEAGNWRQAEVPPTLTSALLRGLRLEFRGRSCYFSWNDPHLQNQIISFVKSNKHWTPQTWFHYRCEWMPLYSTFHCHEIYIRVYICNGECNYCST